MADVELIVTVREWYDAATEGERQHMVNKLVKGGYQSPKAERPKKVVPAPIDELDLQYKVEDIIRWLLRKYPHTLCQELSGRLQPV